MDHERPAVMCSSLVHRGALDSFIHSADKKGERPPAGVARTSTALGIYLGPGEKVVDGAHAIPHAILGEALSKQHQQVAGHIVLPRYRSSNLALVRPRVPKIPPLTLSDRIISQNDEAVPDQV